MTLDWIVIIGHLSLILGLFPSTNIITTFFSLRKESTLQNGVDLTRNVTAQLQFHSLYFHFKSH